ncbi:MAG TPA: ArgE/DapE family deacylase [Acidocella sp.]|uniref:ArgE/DapE family deacylase n=1 Tax=Acidocella sp. TaxID=50710 RepID=UPI002C7CB13A|nr:ArgE/DapE family deacylase [Acidocella sp.]HVE23616.1 ArgE/DapE family deacylase [Acidocella sp.]
MTDRIIREEITRSAEAAQRFLGELVRVPSDNPAGDCAPHAEHTARLLEAFGFKVERHVVPAETVRAHGMVSATNLIVRHRFGPGPTIALNAHGDVVPPGTGWSVDPYGAVIKNGWMYGRGVAVSKSDIATYAFALAALRDSKAALNGTVELHITYDEETGGEIGPGWLLAQNLTKPDLAIGAGFSYAVVNAHNGCLHLEVTVSGKSAHAAMPATGADALEATNAILTALYQSRAALSQTISAIPGIGTPQITVGLITGGINTNVVPDRIVFRLDRRVIPDEATGDVETNLIRDIQQAAAHFPGITVEARRILAADPLVPSPGAARLTELLCARASEIFGEPIIVKGVPLYTDARHYAAAGVPIILYGAGPRTIELANAHRADERLELADLRRATEVIALTIFDLLARQAP